MNMKHTADILVIGGGAAGISAAVAAKEANPAAEVMIAEKLPRIGKKILATGNGRCNLGNVNILPEHYHGGLSNTMQIIEKFDLTSFFASLGVFCIADDSGRLYPHSNTATSVVSAFCIRLAQLGIREVCGFNVKSIVKKDGKFIISDGESSICTQKIVITVGGSAAPVFGTDGSFNRVLQGIGHTFTPVYPAVAPLKVDPESVRGLKGLRAKVRITAVVDGIKIAEELGEIQFNDGQISGICVFNISHLWRLRKKEMTVLIDFAPQYDFNRLLDIINRLQTVRTNCSIDELLTGIFHKNICAFLLKSLKINLSDSVKNLEDRTLKLVANRIKSLEIPIIGVAPWANAQATCGGICGKDVDENLQSKICEGIYFAGEILDVDGICGGYNLMWAWASGTHAGRAAGGKIK